MSFYRKIKNFIFRLRKRAFVFPHTARAVRVRYRQDLLAQSKADDLLQLVHVDGVAFIYSIELNAILGELEKPLMKKLCKLFGKGFCLDGKIVSVTGGLPYKYYGLLLEIYDTKTYLAQVDDFTSLRGQ